MFEYEYILVDHQSHQGIGIVQLNRPKELNALNLQLMKEIADALIKLDENQEIKCIIITGNERAFAAGADIKQMQGRTAMDMLIIDQFSIWDSIRKTRKPLIAAVSGFALGGGCELSMLCDMIIASETAQFGQPEIKIGTMPGAGGTQRLTRLVGKSKAMEMILTGRMMDATEAERAGLVSRVVPLEQLIPDALKTAEKIASMSLPITMMAKDAVNRAYEVSLNEGIHCERRLFHATFATEDQKEGMNAFSEKRPPVFKDQ
jgi:enoyl-CoA hydratase